MESYAAVSGDAPLWQLAVACVTELRTMTFAAQGGEAQRAVAPASIVIRKNDPAHPDEVFAENEIKPGILVMIGGGYNSPWNEGNVHEEDVYYQILFQLIDVDSNDKWRKLRSHLKWQNQISRRLNQASLIAGIEDVCLGHVAQVETIDEKKWARHQSFVGGVLTRWLSRELNDNE